MKETVVYDQGYRQALEDVAKLIKTSPVPEFTESGNKHDFWLLMRKLTSSDKNKFAIFSSGYRVALKDLSQRVLSLSKNF